jgi:tRNA threonylcarbamoyladenosine biosynthesis protein TsaE
MPVLSTEATCVPSLNHHGPILGTRLRHWPDEAACAADAQALARQAALADAFLALEGPLGAGKTTFARHLLRALGATGRIKSPSFAVMEPYALPLGTVSHFDFYRFSDPREWEDAGFREVFAAPGLKLAEWPAKAAGLVPLADLVLHITPQAGGEAQAEQEGDGEPRELRASAYSATGLRLLQAWGDA